MKRMINVLIDKGRYCTILILLSLLMAQLNLLAETIEVKTSNDTVYVWDYNAWEQCAFQLDYTVEIIDSMITITQIDTAEDMTTCYGYHNFVVPIVNLPPGSYQISIYRDCLYEDIKFIKSIHYQHSLSPNEKQEESAVDFYPLSVGNQWLYRTSSYDVGTEPSSVTYSFKEVIGDTVMDNGFRYFIISEENRKQYERFDTLTNQIRYYSVKGYEDTDIPIYSLDYIKDSTVVWEGSFDLMTYEITYMVDEVSGSFIIHLNGDGLYGEHVYFLEHVGMLYRTIGEIGYSATGLIGARIDGKVWGDLSSVEKREEYATDFQLLQNYPNPFNPMTTITFSLPENSKTTMHIYDAWGRLVATLLDRELEKGNHSVTFDGSDFPSGIYFCHLQTAYSQKYIRKMMLIK